MKKLILNTQCRRCLKSLTYKDVESSICKCGKNRKEHSGESLFCDGDADSIFTPKIISKLVNRDLCGSCLAKDEKKANKIKRSQRKIGIKATRKKKVQWKDPKPVELKPNDPLPFFYLKRKASVIYVKYSLKGKWTLTSKQKLSHLERTMVCRGNPDKPKLDNEDFDAINRILSK